MKKVEKQKWYVVWALASAVCACFAADSNHLFAACCVSFCFAMGCLIESRTEKK